MIFVVVDSSGVKATSAHVADELPESIVVQVVPVRNGRAIGWGDGFTEKLRDRVADLRAAVIAGVRAIAFDPADLPVRDGWQVSELSASFGITLAAEAGVLLSKTATEATFEVTVTFSRK